MKVIALDGHPRSEELADYVGDLLGAAECERIEAHVSSCPRCAARLEQAAGFQMLLHDAAASRARPAAASPSLPAAASPSWPAAASSSWSAAASSSWSAAASSSAVAASSSRLGRVRRGAAAVGGAWAAAAAFTLMLWTSGEVEPHQRVATRVAAPALPTHVDAPPRRAGCSDDDPSCTEGLLASVDPLESIDPLSSWPDDPLVRSGFAELDQNEGEPCGSGEDGGPLVCPTDPFSG